MDRKCLECNEDFVGIDSEYKGSPVYICPNQHRSCFEVGEAA